MKADMVPATSPPACAAVCAAVISREAHTNMPSPAAESNFRDTVPMSGICMRLSGADTNVALMTASVAADAPSNNVGSVPPTANGNVR